MSKFSYRVRRPLINAKNNIECNTKEKKHQGDGEKGGEGRNRQHAHLGGRVGRGIREINNRGTGDGKIESKEKGRKLR